MATALELAQAAAVEMGLTPPQSIFGTTELIPLQLGALLNLTGQMLVKRRVWRRLFRETTIAAVAGQATYPLPADFARPISQTEWNRVNSWPMAGPASPQQWQSLNSSGLGSGPREAFRLVGNTIEVWPVPGTGVPTPVTFSYYYVSKWWATDSSGQLKEKCTQDGDTTIFDDRLMTSGIKLRFYQAKQFDTTSFASEFQTNLDDAIAQDSGAQVLSLSGPRASPLISIANLPDSGYGQ